MPINIYAPERSSAPAHVDVTVALYHSSPQGRLEGSVVLLHVQIPHFAIILILLMDRVHHDLRVHFALRFLQLVDTSGPLQAALDEIGRAPQLFPDVLV